MRTILIQNAEIKALLEEKAEIIEEGKNINVEIEKKSEPIVEKYLADMGIVSDGESEETFGDGTSHYKTFKGIYIKLQNAFRDSSVQILQEQLKKDLEDDLNILKSKELQVTAINEKFSGILRSDVLPTLELGEFEQVTTLNLVGIDIELTIVDAVEEYKQRYLESKAKADAQDTQASPANDNQEVV